jgi:hypothetical protein
VVTTREPIRGLLPPGPSEPRRETPLSEHKRAERAGDDPIEVVLQWKKMRDYEAAALKHYHRAELCNSIARGIYELIPTAKRAELAKQYPPPPEEKDALITRPHKLVETIIKAYDRDEAR